MFMSNTFQNKVKVNENFKNYKEKSEKMNFFSRN